MITIKLALRSLSQSIPLLLKSFHDGYLGLCDELRNAQGIQAYSSSLISILDTLESKSAVQGLDGQELKCGLWSKPCPNG
jgi:hypothetical protein